MAIYNVSAHSKQIQLEEPIFSTSGITTGQHTNALQAMPTNIANSEYFYENSLANLLNQNGAMDLEVIAIDPDYYYSTSEDDDEESMEDSSDGDEVDAGSRHLDNEHVAIMNEAMLTSFDADVNTNVSQTTRTTDDVLDIDIHDLCTENLFLYQHDDILFSNDKSDKNDFDLASYITDDTSSVLLSTPAPKTNVSKPVMAAQSLKSQQPNLPVKRKLLDDINEQKVQNVRNTTDLSKAYVTNRSTRKRKAQLSKEFIESSESDSDSSDELEVDVEGDDDVVYQTKKADSNSKSKLDKDMDWTPESNTSKGVAKKVLKEQPAQNVTFENNNLRKPDKEDISTSGKPSNGLRHMIHKQMLSAKPIKGASIMKKYSEIKAVQGDETNKSKAIDRGKTPTAYSRGKDIQITAKYYKSSSDDSDSSYDKSVDIKNSGNVKSENSPKSENPRKNENSHVKNDKRENIQCKRKLTEMRHQSKMQKVVVNPKTTVKMGYKVEKSDSNVSKENDKSIAFKIKDNVKSNSKISVPVKSECKINSELINDRVPPLIPNTVCKSSDTGCKSETQFNVYKQADSIEKQIKVEVPETNVESQNTIAQPVKKKLNIQEYLKRRNISTLKNDATNNRNTVLGNLSNVVTNGKAEDNEKENKTSEIVSCEQSLYEEIIIVSMGCNTDISIPELKNLSKTAPQSVVAQGKSAILLCNIQDTLDKATANRDLSKISSNSLISSIQNVILKKSTIQSMVTVNDTKDLAKAKRTDGTLDETKDASEREHGENKVIMHLRKDRVRPSTNTIYVQTEPYFQFPPLDKLHPPIQVFETESNENTKSHSKYNSNNGISNQTELLSESSYHSDDDQKTQRRSRYSDYYSSSSRLSNCSSKKSYNFKRNSSKSKNRQYHRNDKQRTISRSLNESSNSSRSSSSSSDSATSSASSSTTSRSFSESDSDSSRTSSCRTFNSYGGSSTTTTTTNTSRFIQRRERRSSYRRRFTSPEERRIVYVGRLEPDTTKEVLSKKFAIYGTVKNVSIHYKEMQWKYGFVTFSTPAEAYTAIENASKNPDFSSYDISFGGRRAFCKQTYFDLDNIMDDFDYMDDYKLSNKEHDDNNSFEALLKETRKKLQKQKN